jgi:hypothetical protein
MSKPLIGKLLSPTITYNRDAIHVPIMPVVALVDLNPGEKISLKKKGDIFVAGKARAKTVAIVDPYLDAPVKAGEQFFAWIKPATVQKLWHEWSHPIFDKD